MSDLKFAFRQLLKNPGFTAVAVLTLALGIGANTAIFSVVNAVLLRPLPYPAAHQLVRLFEKVDRVAMAGDHMEVAPANFLDWQAQSRSFSGIAAFLFGGVPLATAGGADRVESAHVTHNLFSVLGVNAMLGRTFALEEDQPANARVAVLSHGLWLRHFGGDADAIGRTIDLDGRTYQVIGVMPPRFQFPRLTELWKRSSQLSAVLSQPWDQIFPQPGCVPVQTLKRKPNFSLIG